MQREGLAAERVSLVYNGIELARFVPPAERVGHRRFVVLGVGRLHSQKNFALFLEIAQRLPDAEFRIAGTGPEEPMLRALAGRLEHEAAEYESLRLKSPATTSKTELRTLVQAQIDAEGLARSTTRIEAAGPNVVQVVFGAVAFADWLKWVASLQSQQVRLDTCRIETLSTPGLVSITATFTRAKPQ